MAAGVEGERGAAWGGVFEVRGGQRTDAVGLSEVVASAGFWLCREESAQAGVPVPLKGKRVRND